MKQLTIQTLPKLCNNIVARQFKRLALVGLSSALACSSLVASANDFDRAQKELRIMSKIFDTSLADANISKANSVFPGRSGSTQATYLAKQGMVFTFSFSSSEFGGADDWQAFGEGVGRLVGTIASEVSEAFAEIDSEFNDAPRAPITPRSPRPVDEVDAWEEKMEAYEEYRNAMEELRDQQRESRREIRDMQRTIRELEREAKHNSEESSELNKRRAELEKKMKKLSEEQALYQKTMKEYREKKYQKVREKNNKKANVIISTLCDYGSTLRSLEKNEHVTLIFSNFEDNKDQVYVFDYDDISDCSSKDKLLKNAVAYQL